jgi:hypothetical protein
MVSKRIDLEVENNEKQRCGSGWTHRQRSRVKLLARIFPEFSLEDHIHEEDFVKISLGSSQDLF